MGLVNALIKVEDAVALAHTLELQANQTGGWVVERMGGNREKVVQRAGVGRGTC